MGQHSQFFPARRNWKRAMAGLFVLALVFAAAGPAPASAQEARYGFSALRVADASSGTIAMAPGELKKVSVSFKNIGDRVWSNEGSAFVSVYTHGPKYRGSQFDPGHWVWGGHPALLDQSHVAPGEIGTVTFDLRAPQTPNTYKETFWLAAEDLAWIPGGEFTLTIKVADEGAPAPSASGPEPETNDELSALLLLRSSKQVEARGGEAITYTIGVKNTGTKAWGKREVRLPGVSLASVGEDTRHSSWASSSVLALNDEGTVEPGALDFLTFTFVAPKTIGHHTVRYAMAVDGDYVPDFHIDIPVAVTQDAPVAVEAPVREEVVENIGDMIDEPMMRIAFLIVDEETDWKVQISCRENWELVDGNGKVLADMPGGKSVTAYYQGGSYHYDAGAGLKTSASHLRFVPDVKNSICRVDNFDRRVTRNFTHPDNEFRNVLELRYNGHKDRTWVINELPMEMYLRGLAETSNISPMEFQKALITIARTYALYHWERGTKHGKEHYHLSSYSWDQVYNGYGQEQRAPKITEAVEATRGKVVTYQGKTAITPYFSRSDGRTRDWSEVWYGDVAWIKSVPTPCDAAKGYALWGHGVGLSASEALCMAKNGQEWEDILHYFYQGVELKKHWR